MFHSHINTQVVHCEQHCDLGASESTNKNPSGFQPEPVLLFGLNLLCFLTLASTVFNCFQLGQIFWDILQCLFDPPRVGQSHYSHMLNQQVKLCLVVTQQPGDVHRET